MTNTSSDKLLLEPDPELTEALDQIASIGARDIDRKQAVREMAEIARRGLRSEACLILLVDHSTGAVEHLECVGNPEVQRHLCDRRMRWGPLLSRAGGGRAAPAEPIERLGLIEEGFGVLLPQVARQHRLHALLAHPLLDDRGLFGYLVHFSPRNAFSEPERRLATVMARHISRTFERLENLASRRSLQWLSAGMQKLAEAESEDQLLEILLQVGIDLAHAPRGTVELLDTATGELAIVRQEGGQPTQRKLAQGQGIANVALQEERPIIVDDVTQPPWSAIFVEHWSDTRAELAVPIVVTSAAVRRGLDVVRASRPFGVLNLESPDVGAFTQTDADLLWSLVRHGAVLYGHLQAERKARELGAVHQKILDNADWNETIDIMMSAVNTILGYPYINISLVHQDIGRIRTEYLLGVPPADIERFRTLADHPLDSNDIQAHIYRDQRIEAPEPDDERLDPIVVAAFGQADLVRVFLPMIAPSDHRVIGTLEAGFKRSRHRQYIYEEDVQILKAFIDYTAYALDKRQAYILDKIGHEFRAPLAGIRNNAHEMQRYMHTMNADVIHHKFDDIITDCEILLSQLAELEHILGKPPPPPKIARTLVFRDVVIKTLRQLQPELRHRGLRAFDYDPNDILRLGIMYVDKTRLGQVFLNLITNSIKYAGPNKAEFRGKVEVQADESGQAWLVKVQDWGIGVGEEYREAIFLDGVRTPEAKHCDPTGSGLGLTISRQIMREIGGDLTLTHMSKPTEFVVRLPKALARKPEGDLR